MRGKGLLAVLGVVAMIGPSAALSAPPRPQPTFETLVRHNHRDYSEAEAHADFERPPDEVLIEPSGVTHETWNGSDGNFTWYISLTFDENGIMRGIRAEKRRRK